MLLNIMPLFLGTAADQLGLNSRQLGDIGSTLLVGFSLLSVSALFWMERLSWRVAVALANSVAGVLLLAPTMAPSLIGNHV